MEEAALSEPSTQQGRTHTSGVVRRNTVRAVWCKGAVLPVARSPHVRRDEAEGQQEEHPGGQRRGHATSGRSCNVDAQC